MIERILNDDGFATVEIGWQLCNRQGEYKTTMDKSELNVAYISDFWIHNSVRKTDEMRHIKKLIGKVIRKATKIYPHVDYIWFNRHREGYVSKTKEYRIEKLLKMGR